MPPVSAEATVSRNYIDWLVSVPWKQDEQGAASDLDRAEQILNEDHYGLEKIKERILEFLAVRQLAKKTQSSIICFVGPPGVGKSSLAKSIARATGRKFVRLSLGGVRDEAEIRGHRRTYIGAFPGQIIQMMKKAGTVNPVFLLDEVDKMSMDFRGDPSAALLEVLDPEQNDAFLDHYLDVDYDLSKVMFIATANVVHTIPPALRDRMEIIQLSGYTHEREAGDRPAVPGAAAARGARPRAGEHQVRGRGASRPHRELHPRGGRAQPGARDRRHLPQDRAPGGAGEVEAPTSRSTPSWCGALLGKPKFRSRRKNEESEIGVATGLAWTEVGGELLETEVGLMKGKGKLTLTGKLGEVMQESARAAVSLPAQPRRRARHRARLQREPGHPHPRARGRDPQGRPFGRHHHGDRAGLGAAPDARCARTSR